MLGQAHDDTEPALAFKNLAGLAAADPRFDDMLHIVHIQAIGSDGLPVNFNIEIGLATALLQVVVVGAFNIIEHGRDICADSIQRIQVFAEYFYGDIRFHPAGKFINPHGDGLGEIVGEAGLGFQVRPYLIDDVLFAESVAPLFPGF